MAEPGPPHKFYLMRKTSRYVRATVENRWDKNAGLRRDAVRSQVIDVLEAQEINETGNKEG